MAGLLLILGLGSGVQTASADAEPLVSGSSIVFAGLQPGIPQTIDLHNTSTTGYKYLQSYLTTRNNVAKTCPKSDDFKLSWNKGPGTPNHALLPGACFWPSQPDEYRVTYLRAN